MNEVVKYHNNLSELPLKNFNSSELNILMTLCSKCRNKGTEPIDFTLSELRKLTNYTDKNNDNFIAHLKKTNKKLLELNMEVETDSKIIQFALFPYFEIDKDTYTLTVEVNSKFAYLLNSLSNNFTRFELEEFVNLKSSYSKACYRQLKRFRHTGWWKVSVSDFRTLLDIPTSYNNAEVTRKVLKPIETELTPLFKNLTIDIIRDEHKRGKPIKAYHFYWDEEVRYNDTLSFDPAEPPSEPTTKSSGFICPECGSPLVEKMINGSNCWCHVDGWKKDAPCKMIYNSVAEIEGYKEKSEEEHKGFFSKLFNL